MKTVSDTNSNGNYKGQFFLLLFLAFSAAIIGDNATESLLLSMYDATIVSRFFIVNGIILFLFSFFAMSIIDKFNRGKLYFLFLITYSILILCARIVAEFNIGPLFLLLYSLAYTGKIMMFFFVWTLANDVADSRTGSKAFPVIAAGGTLGALLGTFLIPQIIKFVAAKDLLFLWSIPVLLSALLIKSIISSFGQHFVRRRFDREISFHFGDLLKNITVLKKEPVIAEISQAYFLIFILVFFQQFLFYHVIKTRFAEAHAISTFLGYFNGIALIVTLTLQSTIAGPITHRFGSVRMLNVLPVTFMLSFLSLIFFQSTEVIIFNAVIAGVGLRIAVFDSFFSPNYQNLFSTLPDTIRGSGKMAIDGVVKPSAMIFASILIALLPIKGVVYVAFSLIAFLSMLILKRLRSSYAQTVIKFLSGGISKDGVDTVATRKFLGTEEGIEFLDQVVEEQHLEIKEIAFEMMVDVDSDMSINHLIQWFFLVEPRLQTVIVRVMRKSHNKNTVPFLNYISRSKLENRVISEAILSLGELGECNETLLIPNLDSESARIKANTIITLFHCNKHKKYDLDSLISEMLRSNDKAMERSGLWILSQVECSDFLFEELHNYWYYNISKVLRSTSLWNRFVDAAVLNGNKKLIAELIDSFLIVSETMQERLLNELARKVALVGADWLLSIYGDLTNSYVTSVVLKAIARSGVKLDEIEMLIVEEFAIAEYERAREVQQSLVPFLSSTCTAQEQFFVTVLKNEELEVHFQNMVDCAIIIDETNSIQRVEQRFKSREKRVVSQLIEVVDSIGVNKINRVLIDYLESSTVKNDYFETKRDVAFYYCDSGIPVVRDTAHYLLSLLS